MLRTRLLLGVALTLLIASPAAAIGPTFSVDDSSLSVAAGVLDGFGSGAAYTGAQVLTTTPPGPTGPNPPVPGPVPAPGLEIDGALGSPVGVAPGGLGLLPGFGFEIDALSYGRDCDPGASLCELFFSVDEFAGGFVPAPGLAPNVLTEGTLGFAEAAADVFSYLGPAAPALGPGPGNTDIIDGDGLFPFGGPGTGLLEPIFPGPGVPDGGDNLDALDINTSPSDIAGVVYFSLDAAFIDPLEGAPLTGTAAANLVSGADILVSFAGAAAPGVFAPAGALGLDLFGAGSDDLDALAVNDADGSTTLSAGDFVLFSVRRGSAVIGTLDSAFGIPIEEGDVLTLPIGPPGTPPAIFIAAEALGLDTFRAGDTNGDGISDDLDAIDIVPEPASGSLLLIALGGLALARRRQLR